MHNEPYDWAANAKKKYPEYFNGKRILEVGSLNINGTVRDFFTDCEYIGLDVGPGVGVDIVCPIHEYKDSKLFDVVISTEMLEHDKYWKESLLAMVNYIKKGGLFIFSCAGPTRQEHGTTRTTPGDAPYTTDYYRNISIEDFKSIVNENQFSEYHLEYQRGDADLLFFGKKK